MRRDGIRIWVVGALLAMVATSVPAHAATWAEDNCKGGSTARDTWKRSQALAYAEHMVHEGYEWNGGCYRLNDVDDTPWLATDAGGEGADCSGFVFRVWALKNDGSAGYRLWDYDKDIHGPYYTWDYFAPVDTEPFKLISKTYKATSYMDAFVYYRSDERHVALIKMEGSDGWDYVIHARNNTAGTRIDYLPYRSYSDSKAVMRKAWTLECSPKCPEPV
jgi:hypothetical protein